MNTLESLEQWYAFAAKLSLDGYTLYQMQYGIYEPEGFHAWFFSSVRPQIDIVTRNGDVHDAIVKYKPE